MKAIINEKLYDTTASSVIFADGTEALFKTKMGRTSKPRLTESHRFQTRKLKSGLAWLTQMHILKSSEL